MVQIKCDNTQDSAQLIWNVATVPELPTADSNFNNNSVAQFPEENHSYFEDDTTYPFIKNTDAKIASPSINSQ